jgi:hypothetical protein
MCWDIIGIDIPLNDSFPELTSQQKKPNWTLLFAWMQSS